MRLIIDDFEVEVKARLVNKDRFSRKDTMRFLNKVSIWAGEASKQYDDNGLDSLAEWTQKASDQIYETLRKNGCYKNLES